MKKLIAGLLMIAGVASGATLGDLTRSDYVVSNAETNDVIAEAVGRITTFNVITYGAVGDGTTDDTTAIQAALTAADVAGGGLVYVPDGIFVISSPLMVYDDTTFECSAGATIQLEAGSDCNMMVNEHFETQAGTRNNRITIRGG